MLWFVSLNLAQILQQHINIKRSLSVENTDKFEGIVKYKSIKSFETEFLAWSILCLQELDIRLNPVTKNEPDHRLFLIHMLPSLKKLGRLQTNLTTRQRMRRL